MGNDVNEIFIIESILIEIPIALHQRIFASRYKCTNRSFYLLGDNQPWICERERARHRPLFFVRAGASDPLHFSSPPHRPRAAKASERGSGKIMESDVRSLVGWIRWLNERLRGEETPTKIDNADPPTISLLVCLGLTGGRANKFPPSRSPSGRDLTRRCHEFTASFKI